MDTIKGLWEGAKEKVVGTQPDPEIRQEVLEDYQRAWAQTGDTIPGGEAVMASIEREREERYVRSSRSSSSKTHLVNWLLAAGGPAGGSIVVFLAC